MPIAVEHTVHAIAAVVQTVPIGTNKALMHLLWVMLNGSFLRSRGAVFAALDRQGLTMQEVRRSWAALRSGKWEINTVAQCFDGLAIRCIMHIDLSWQQWFVLQQHPFFATERSLLKIH